MSTDVLKALPGKLDIKRHLPSILYTSADSRCQLAFSKLCLVNLILKDIHLVFSMSRQASRCQHVFSKPCHANLISKDIHLVFYMSRPASRCQQAFSKPCQVKLDIKRHSSSILYVSASLTMSTGVL